MRIRCPSLRRARRARVHLSRRRRRAASRSASAPTRSSVSPPTSTCATIRPGRIASFGITAPAARRGSWSTRDTRTHDDRRRRVAQTDAGAARAARHESAQRVLRRRRRQPQPCRLNPADSSIGRGPCAARSTATRSPASPATRSRRRCWQRHAPGRPQLQVSPAARHPDRRQRRAERAGRIALRRTARAEHRRRPRSSCSTGSRRRARTAGRRCASTCSLRQLVARPFFAAGFYYKTFMWPASFWERVYEPLIRRAAGLGRAAARADPDHYEQAYAFCDVLVIGAGPAGLAAALAAARSGARVIVCDEDFRVRRTAAGRRREIDGMPGHLWASRVVAELAQLARRAADAAHHRVRRL